MKEHLSNTGFTVSKRRSASVPYMYTVAAVGSNFITVKLTDLRRVNRGLQFRLEIKKERKVIDRTSA
jgi:hypothetical protein